MAELIERGLLTDEGKKVVAWFEAQMPDRASDAFVDAFNALPGHVKHYLTTVKVSGILTAESWIADYPASAQAGLRDIQDAEAKVEESAKVEEAVDKTAELQTQFASLKESLEEQIAALTQQIASMAAAKGGRKPKMQPEIPAEMAAEDMETES